MASKLTNFGRVAVVLSLGLVLSACGGGSSSEQEPRSLMKFRNADGTPDEFAISPARPLQAPPSEFALPEPTRNGVNRANQNPLADAIVALGGTEAALRGSGVPSRDSALVAQTSRFGTDVDIRARLTEEDRLFRLNNPPRLLERLSGTTYYDVYARQSLNQQAETERLRALGIPTPAAPPKELKPD